MQTSVSGLQKMSLTSSLFADATVIPAKVRAKVSLRIVPDQDLDTISKSLVDYILSSFASINSSNALKV